MATKKRKAQVSRLNDAIFRTSDSVKVSSWSEKPPARAGRKSNIFGAIARVGLGLPGKVEASRKRKR